jgi:hypothetical protein
MHHRASSRLLLVLTAFAIPIAATSSRALSHPGKGEADGTPEKRAQASSQEPKNTVANRHAGGLLSFDVADAETGKPIPCKLTFVGVEGTPRPVFTHNDIGRPETPARPA